MLVLRAVGMHCRYKVCGLAQVTHPAAHLVVAGNILTWLPRYLPTSNVACTLRSTVFSSVSHVCAWVCKLALPTPPPPASGSRLPRLPGVRSNPSRNHRTTEARALQTVGKPLPTLGCLMRLSSAA